VPALLFQVPALLFRIAALLFLVVAPSCRASARAVWQRAAARRPAAQDGRFFA